MSLPWCSDYAAAILPAPDLPKTWACERWGGSATRGCVDDDLPPHSRGESHRTDTLDYLIVMSGEVDRTDGVEIFLKAATSSVERTTRG